MIRLIKCLSPNVTLATEIAVHLLFAVDTIVPTCYNTMRQYSVRYGIRTRGYLTVTQLTLHVNAVDEHSSLLLFCSTVQLADGQPSSLPGSLFACCADAQSTAPQACTLVMLRR